MSDNSMNFIRIKPMNFKVLIRKIQEEQKTDSGIILQDSDFEPRNHAVVEEVGPGYLNDSGVRTPLSVKKGDKVLYSPGFATTKIDDELLIVDESSIVGVFEDDDKEAGDKS